MSNTKRVRKILIPALLIVILAVSMLAVFMSYSKGSQQKANPDVYVGVAFAGNTTAEAKQLIDKVKDYTNLFIFATGGNPISTNQSEIEEICDYAVANGLSVIVNVGVKDAANASSWNWFWQQSALDAIKQRWTEMWGDKFLGMYYNDEPGGIQLDASWRKVYESINMTQSDFPAAKDLNDIKQKLLDYVNNGTKPDNYDAEANFFIQDVLTNGDPGLQNLTAAKIPTFTSDYGLYWWDYLGGYSTIFAELGWNNSIAEQIDLVKGAARLQDKDWGTIITWKYYSPPYLDSGEEIYNQMLMSYQAGAKYISIFNYPYDGGAYGTLTEEHFEAMQKFWNDITTKQFADLSTPKAALVLPNNFGWGMRNPNDTIWGFWLADNRTQQTALVTSKLLAYYGTTLDIVYEDQSYPVAKVNYQHVYYWNSTTP
jgi:organic radical activating enzyme